MNMMFVGKYGQCEFTAEGLTVHRCIPDHPELDMHRFYPYGSLKAIKYSGLTEKFIVKTKKGTAVDIYLSTPKQDKVRADEAVKYVTAAIKTAPAADWVEISAIDPQELVEQRTHNMHCKLCGHIFCYTDDDINTNERNKQIVKMSELNAVVSYAGSLYQINEADKQLERDRARIKDYTKCPNCNSADIEELSKTEIEAIKSKNSVVSPVEELKKYKELLDGGIITQEEFDAKKKQLLGL